MRGTSLLWVLFLARLPTEFASGVCELPPSWVGNWFESGVREGVNITLLELSHKGTCIRSRQQNQFIFKDRHEGCYRCLSMYEKHANILQYKESRCVADRTHRQICHSISVDEPLKTLFRVRSAPELCPITGHFTFSYSRGHGECGYPLSSLSQCRNGSSLVFRYQACPDIKGSESGIEWAHCVASWREGSTDYFVARLEHPLSSSWDHESSFRCFVYKKNYSGFLVSMSGGAECNLYTATEGHTTFKIKKLEESETRCEYPTWFRNHRRYMSIDAAHQYHLNHKGTILSLRGKEEDGSEGLTQENKLTAGLEEIKNLECSKIYENSENSTKMVVLSTMDCESGFQCVQLEKVSENVVRLQVGRLTHTKDEACHPQLFFNNIHPILLTSLHLSSQVCPLSGQYKIRSDLSPGAAVSISSVPKMDLDISSVSEVDMNTKCPSLLSSCTNTHTLTFSHNCGKSVQDYNCHDSWETGLNQKMLILSQSALSAKKFCIIVNKTKDDLSLVVRTTCDTEAETTGDSKKIATTYHGDCSPTALATANGISSWQLSSVLLDLILMHVFQSLRGVNMDPDFI
ncbi:uncharacterized protein LOC111714108 [Eurytemora carolleeae]|uniref:uncharacterized protein LOC111714108 n=1 Tax=Eurytemora carolleeae TaxID=1294199 RepID=UPI000C789EF9|nr:uncharacterized protein LOC111714108 [Eurytemora carolleeae]|eukprot:XP_023344916.1 uncharacterized protein LOC111714108 [Eurytemora affinis]